MGHRRGELTAVSLFAVVSMLGLVACGSDDDSSGSGAAQATSAPAGAATTVGSRANRPSWPTGDTR
jgi:ABC-type phosphate transport system substrate-binding protein